MLMRVDDRRGSDTSLDRLEEGLPPLWAPAQALRSWLHEGPVLKATPAGANKQPICEATIIDSMWSWPM
jgi:hypothetical protein